MQITPCFMLGFDRLISRQYTFQKIILKCISHLSGQQLLHGGVAFEYAN